MLQHSQQKITILPLGAHEYHGHHLPPETDWLIAEGLVTKVKKQIPPHLDIHILPVEKIGYSIEHKERETTKTFSFDQAAARWIDIGKRLFEGGDKKIVFFNAHGGNSPLLTVVITELRATYPILAVATHWTRFGLPQGIITAEEKALDIHGGFVETSVMLALHPDKVDMKKAENFKNRQEDFIRDYTYLRAYGSHAFGWMMRDLNPQGAAGNALKANAEAGHQIINHAVNGFITLLEDIDRFDVSTLT